DAVVHRAQLRIELAPGAGRGAHADDAVDAHPPGDQAGVAGAEDEHAGTVAVRALAHPDRPARFGDQVAGLHRILHLAAGRVDVQHPLVDAQVIGHLDHALDGRGEIVRPPDLVAPPPPAPFRALPQGLLTI